MNKPYLPSEANKIGSGQQKNASSRDHSQAPSYDASDEHHHPHASECALGYNMPDSIHESARHHDPVVPFPKEVFSPPSSGRMQSLSDQFDTMRQDMDAQITSLLTDFANVAPIILANPGIVGNDRMSTLRKAKHLDILLGQTRLASQTIMDGMQLIGLTIRNLESLMDIRSRHDSND